MPESTEEVCEVLRWARAHRVPVTPRGAGSGMTGGCLPVRGGMVLSTERMARIREIDERDLVAVVEPGVILEDLQRAVEERGLFYPPDPASLGFCSVGGNVATNAGGPRAFKYGVTREYTIGLEVVRMGGERIRCGRRTAKGVTGYDVTALFVGSEGTLGVVTEIVVKLIPLPRAVSVLLGLYPTLAAAGNAVAAVLRDGARPRCVEFMDRETIAHVRHVRPKSAFSFPPNVGAALLVELDGEPEAVEASTLKLAQLCEQAGATDVLVAKDSQERRTLWETRRSASRALKEAHRVKINEDIVVPRGEIAAMLARVEQLASETKILVATFGHAGDGNLHVNLLDDGQTSAARLEEATAALFRATLDLGGTLSGEHGIGISKARYLEWEQSSELIELQRNLKATLDPDGLMNPGKIFA